MPGEASQKKEDTLAELQNDTTWSHLFLRLFQDLFSSIIFKATKKCGAVSKTGWS